MNPVRKTRSLPPGPLRVEPERPRGDLQPVTTDRKSAPAWLQGDLTQGRPEVVKLWSISKSGPNPGEIRNPKDACFVGVDKLAVSESANSRVQFLNTTSGETEYMLDPETDAGLLRPGAISVSKDHEILFAADMNQVHLLDPHRKTCMDCCVLPKDCYYGVHGACGDLNDNLIISNVGTHSSVAIFHLDRLSKPIRKLKGDFGEPYYVAMDYDHGLIYVSDGARHCVHVYDKHGKKCIRRIGNEDSYAPHTRLLWPMGICVDKEGNLLVADRGQDRVAVYDKNGTFLYQLFNEQDGVKGPISIATDNQGHFALVEETLNYGKDKFSVTVFQENKTKIPVNRASVASLF